MKILHITTKYLPISQTFIGDLVQQLSISGYQNRIFTQNIITDGKSYDYPIVDISYRHYPTLIRRLLNFINNIRGLSSNINFRKAKKELNSFAPDIIHCHFGTAAYFYASLKKATKNDIPVIISFHGYDVFRIDTFESNYKKTIEQLSSHQCICTCPSEFLKKHIIDTFDIPSEKVRVVPNGFNDTLFNSKPLIDNNITQFKLLHIGRFINLKGQEYLIEALALLKVRGYTNIELTLIGEGETLEKTKVLANTLNVSEQIVFTGALPHKAVSQILENCDLYLHPSYTLNNGQAETFGIAILEAIATGKPVIMTDSGGMKEILPNGDASFVKIISQKSAEALAEAIIYFIKEIPLFNKVDFIKYQNDVITKNNLNKTSKLIQHCYKQLS
jgi:colanic acid/amylovoran biosynthesis glycosyltransferase